MFASYRRPNWASSWAPPPPAMPAQTNHRYWLGPMLLILVIAFIYVFSLMPGAPPPREVPFSENYHRRMVGEERHVIISDHDSDIEVDSECLNHGIYNETNDSCLCPEGFTGDRCQNPPRTICMNNGIYSTKLGRCLCHVPFTGEHCQHKCHGGFLNRTSGNCECLDRFFGPGCDIICLHGDIINNTCKCFPGYVGISCATCDPSYLATGECEHYNAKRRGAVNSRLTLSGLSFCMVTIGLLCITARRRRGGGGGGVQSEDTWYRVLNTAPNRTSHAIVCGGSFFPRDRTLVVAPGRPSSSPRSGRRNHGSRSSARRLATPPPSYTSVDNLTDEQLPPSYEEATRAREEDHPDLIVDETDETKTETPASSPPPPPASPELPDNPCSSNDDQVTV